MAVTDNRTPNFSFPLTDASNTLSDDQARINEALMIVDTRFQEIINQTQSPDAGTLGGEDLAFVLALANATGILPITKGGTGASDAAGARTALGIDAAWDAKFADALSVAPAQLDTILEIVAEIQDNESAIAAINTVLANKANQTALDATNARVTTAETELNVVLPDGATGTFTYPRMTTTERDALDMTGKAKGYRIHHVDVGIDQDEEWDGAEWDGLGGSGLSFDTGDLAFWFGITRPEGWSAKAFSPDASAKYPVGLLEGYEASSDLTARLIEVSETDLFLANPSNGDADPFAGFFMIDVATGVFTQTSSPTDARGHTQNPILLPSGEIMLVGGANGSGYAINSCEKYNPLTDTWTALASLPSTRSSAGVILSQDGLKVYVFGGSSSYDTSGVSKNVFEYTIATDTWATLVSLNQNTGGEAGASGVWLSSGKMLYINNIARLYRHDFATGVHDQAALLGVTLTRLGSCRMTAVTIDGVERYFVIENGSGRLWEYSDGDGVSGTVSFLGYVSYNGPMLIADDLTVTTLESDGTLTTTLPRFLLEKE